MFRKKPKTYKVTENRHLNDLFRDNTEYQTLARKNREYVVKLKKDQNVIDFGKLIGLSKSYDEDAPLTSRKSAISVLIDADGTYLPTNMVVDPYFLRPILGPYHESDEEDEEESIEMPRGNRFTYTALNGKICQFSGTSDEFRQDGRTLLNYLEAMYFLDTVKNNDIKFIAVPYDKLSPLQFSTIINTSMRDVKNGRVVPETNVGKLREILYDVFRAHSLSIPAWEQNALILTLEPERYGKTEDDIDDYERMALHQVSQGNAYYLPVWCDASIVTEYWENKQIYPKKNNVKRTQLDASIYETSSPKQAKLSPFEKLSGYITELEELMHKASKSPQSSMNILSQHAETAQNAHNEVE